MRVVERFIGCFQWVLHGVIRSLIAQFFRK